MGVGLNDSPAGLLAWIVEKFRAWSDCDGDPESCFTRDQLLTNVMLYWLTQTATSSARLYWETNQSGVLTEKLPFIEVPTGVARYPKEVLRWPRSWVEQQYNVTHWATMPRGGHFAAMEQPRALRRRPAGVLPDRALRAAGGRPAVSPSACAAARDWPASGRPASARAPAARVVGIRRRRGPRARPVCVVALARA